MRVPRRRLPAPFHSRPGVCAAVCFCLLVLLMGNGTALATGAGRTLRIIGFTDSSVAPGSTLVNPGGFIVDVIGFWKRRTAEAPWESPFSDAGPIHLLLTDLVMPEMGGIDLARRFSELYPDAPILLMSGYSDRAFAPSLAQGVIEKPFVTSVLLRRVREVLDKQFAGSQAGPGLGYRT